jgi:quercetin dioxygenase-like cupin family protein
MKSYKKYFILLLGTVATNIIMAQENKISRRELSSLVLDTQKVAKVEMQEITLGSGLSAPKHLHPCPVVGIITSGNILFQIEGKKKIILKTGDSFYEPKNTTILHFDNASTAEPVTFIAIYLKEGEEENIKMIKS